MQADVAVSLAPIEPNSLVDMATIRLREAIVRGHLRPGQHLAEPALARQIHVSRSPIRAALQTLEQEGLVSRLPNRGCYVWQPAERDVDEILSLRVMLESLAAEETIDRLTEDDFSHLQALIERQRTLIQAKDHFPLIHADKEFHEYICRRASHARLVDWWRQIMGQWDLLIYLRMQHSPDQVAPSVLTDHGDLLDAFMRRDLEQVIALHRSINRRVGRHIKYVLRDLGLVDETGNPVEKVAGRSNTVTGPEGR